MLTVIMKPDSVSVHEKHNDNLLPPGPLNFIWPIADFEAALGVTAPANLYQLNYEPRRALYHKVTETPDGGPNLGETFKGPGEDPTLNWIANHEDEIRRATEYQVLKEGSPYPGDEYTWDGTAWVYTQDPNKLTLDADRWLQLHSKDLAIAVSYLWDAAEAEGLFAKHGIMLPKSVTTFIGKIRSRRAMFTTN